MKYKLKRDLPFAKAGDGHKIFCGEGGCDLIDKDGFTHTLVTGDEKFTEGVERLISEGWIEKIKPREFWLIKDPHMGVIGGYDSESMAIRFKDGCHGGTYLDIIKVREVIE